MRDLVLSSVLLHCKHQHELLCHEAVRLVSAHWHVWLGNLLLWLLVSRHVCTVHRKSLMALRY